MRTNTTNQTALQVECPFCQAWKGQPCKQSNRVTGKGGIPAKHTTFRIHKARVERSTRLDAARRREAQVL